ncbi:hypothetical protein GCM10009821_05910 [Aeromicrobium halocynthiae]|uniref:Uncharacterized protein n=1 Tax=Aeromicrobium halocynthiae TaxID=560557 RepID=A0ABN2VT86_9ACTN
MPVSIRVRELLRRRARYSTIETGKEVAGAGVGPGAHRATLAGTARRTGSQRSPRARATSVCTALLVAAA